MSKNAEGWIRHRGGKCPVEVGTLIDIRCRDGLVRNGVPCGKDFTRTASMFWSHEGDGAEVMAYRLHKPAEQQEPDSCFSKQEAMAYVDAHHSFVGEPGGPLQWRDRITEIDATTQALTAERADLVQKLAGEGFALIGRAVDTAVCQPDPGRWMIGDSVECVSSNYSFITVGTVYVITGFDRNMVQFLDDDGTEMEYERANFKFHSRPSA